MSIQISVDGLLTFFDEKPKDSEGHATSIVSFAGEELATALFMHYAEREKILLRLNAMMELLLVPSKYIKRPLNSVTFCNILALPIKSRGFNFWEGQVFVFRLFISLYS